MMNAECEMRNAGRVNEHSALPITGVLIGAHPAGKHHCLGSAPNIPHLEACRGCL